MIKKRLVRKTTALAITGALTIAMTATVLAAPGGPGGNGGPGGPGGPSKEMQQGGAPNGEAPTGERPEMPSGEALTGERPEMPSGETPTGERPEMPSGETPTGERPEMPSGEAPTGERPEMPSGETPTGERPEMPSGEAPTGERSEMPGGKGMKGINTDEIASAIDAIEDEETKANLEALLSDYEAAKSALDEAMEDGSEDVDTYMEAEKSAMEALRAALDETGIDTRPQRPDGNNQKDMRQGGNMKGFDAAEIKIAIEALEDEEVKSNLETLLNDYETARAALETAMEEESEDIDSYRDAEIKAMEALRTALDEAGIDTRPEFPKGDEQDGEEGNKPAIGQRPDKQTDDSTDSMPEKPAMQQNGNADNGNDAASESILAKISNWLKSLFSR